MSMYAWTKPEKHSGENESFQKQLICKFYTKSLTKDIILYPIFILFFTEVLHHKLRKIALAATYYCVHIHINEVVQFDKSKLQES